MNAPLPPASSDRVSELTRRRLIAGGIAAGGAVTAGTLLGSGGSVAADEPDLDSPGKALQNAQRMNLLPAPDEILFPVIVGEEDSCYVLNNFGDCRGNGCSRSHEGVDIMADRGLPIRAVEAGVLTKRYEDSGKTYGAGNGWTLFSASTGTTWKFFHMDDYAEGLEVGDSVQYGQIIGYVGNTGTSGAFSDRNYHLHFEYRPDNIARDSFDKLQRDTHVSFAD